MKTLIDNSKSILPISMRNSFYFFIVRIIEIVTKVAGLHLAFYILESDLHHREDRSL